MLSPHLAALAVAAQLIPFTFWQTLSPPPPLAGFGGVSGSALDQIALTVDFPSDVSGYATVVIRRAAGASAPADCSSGTAVKSYAAPTFPDPNPFVDTGTGGQAYSYRACIVGTNGQSTSSNVVLNVTARACGGTTVAGGCWYYGSTNQSCDTVCAGAGGYHAGTQTTGQSQCKQIVDTITGGYRTVGTGNCNSLYGNSGLGCGWSSAYGYGRCNESSNSGAAHGWVRRFCRCQF